MRDLYILVGVLLVFPNYFAYGSDDVESLLINQNNNYDIHLRPSQNLSEVRYLLWTSNNPGDSEYYVLQFNDLDNLQDSPFNENLRTYFLIHGWHNNGEADWILQAKANLLSLSDCNVISVDWSTLAESLDYLTCVHNVYKVASLNAEMIDWLVAETAQTTSQIHIIGHSLGGQQAGMTGHYVTSGKIDRVTGLDPAGPLFYSKPPNERIDVTSASFVDIIHTNSGSPKLGCIGLAKNVGTVDFYPNGGHHQPGCSNHRPVKNFIDLFSGCSHARSYDYWVESILAGLSEQYPLEFWSWPCDNYRQYLEGRCASCGDGCLTMGFHVSRNTTGTYYLSTNEESPFAKGFAQSSFPGTEIDSEDLK